MRDSDLDHELGRLARQAGEGTRPLPASRVRELGARRRRRRTAATSAGALLTAIAVGGLAITASGAEPGEPPEVAAPSGTASPTEDVGVLTVPTPAETEAPAPDVTTGPPEPTEPSAGELRMDVPEEALLTPDDLTWPLEPVMSLGVESANPCLAGSDDAVQVGSVAYGVPGSDQEIRVSHTVITQETAEQSSQQLRYYGQDIMSCLMSPEHADGVDSYESAVASEYTFDGETYTLPESFDPSLAESQSYRIRLEEPEAGDASSYVVLVRYNNALSVVTFLDTGEVNDPTQPEDAVRYTYEALSRMVPVYGVE